MYVVVASNSDGRTSVYGVFTRETLAQEWAGLHMTKDVELIVMPVLDPRDDRRRGQRSAGFSDALAPRPIPVRYRTVRGKVIEGEMIP